MNIIYRIKTYILFRIKAKNQIQYDIHFPFKDRLASEKILQVKKNNQLLPQVETLRKQLKSDTRRITIHDLGTGGRKTPYQRKVSSIARLSISSSKQCRLLYFLAKETNPASVIELGTSLGISALSLALGASKAKVYTIEGCNEIASIAKENFENNGVSNITSIIGSFDDVLPGLLPQLTSPFIAYIDGNHSYDSTLRYFEKILPFTDENSLLIFDDIHWSAEMEKAWNVICQHQKVALTIDLFQPGLVFFCKGLLKKHYYLKY